MLYRNIFIRLYINDYINEKIFIKCEMRQKDSFNYILFVIVINKLTRYLQINIFIQNIIIRYQIIKSLIYANNIIMIIRN